MDATELGQSALVGWRERVADSVAQPISKRTGVEEKRLRALIGGLFFALSAYYVAGTIRRAFDDVRA